MGQKGIITEWDIQALLDNALSPEEKAYVLQALQDDPELQARYNQLNKQKTLLQLWWKDH